MERQWLIEEFINVWSVYGQQYRTTNYIEGWHNKLNHEFGTKHPNPVPTECFVTRFFIFQC